MSYSTGEVTEVTVPAVAAEAALSVVVKYYGSEGAYQLQMTQSTGPDFEFGLVSTGSGSSDETIVTLPPFPLGVNAPAENEEGTQGTVTVNYVAGGKPKKKDTIVIYEDPN